MHHTAQQINSALKQAEHVLIISHKNPDGDTLSSACALMQYLRTIEITHTAFCATAINPLMRFLPHIEYFVTDHALFERMQFDTIVVLDSGDLAYAGVAHLLSALSYEPTIINIDHHITNTRYGNHNLVIPDAASTTEVLYRFFKANHIALDTHIATCLMTGLITDTDHFSNPATSASALQTGADLLRAGANLNLIRGWTLRNHSIKSLKLWGRVFSRLTKNPEHDMAYTVITLEDQKEFSITDKDMEGIANFLNTIGEAKIALLLKEQENGTIKGSFRTTADEVDVAALAKSLGGGGHKKAAGFTVPGRLEESSTGWRIV
ncbi:MAG: DHH family phosphoesterase [Candidatus Magasanikbacteria bacterium]|nr:DHH family phosphoesterase [Candidatus Magasanikbacteria bacterium]